MSLPTQAAPTWLHWLSLLLLLTSLAGIFSLPMPPPDEIMGLQLAFTPDAFGSTYSQWTAEQQHAFIDHFPHDFLFIAAYALSGYLWAGTRLLASLPAAWLPFARWSLPLAGVLDVGENLLEMYLLDHLVGLPATLAMLAATCATFKWALTGVFVLLLAYALRRH